MTKRARWASDPNASRGRLHPEAESATRTPFQRDRDRIIHSTAFRRLKAKTQVFIAHEDDHFRTRLTHSLEVAQVARSVARELGLDEDLAETLALAHDVGHPPFGHVGETALDAALAAHGGFDHNAQTLKVLTKIEVRYPSFDGLNLTWETLEGAVKHNGPMIKPNRPAEKLPAAIAAYNALHDLELHTFAGPEAQVAALADDIAYTNHDLDDGLRAGFFSLDELMDLPLVGQTLAGVRAQYPDIGAERQGYELVRRLIGIRIRDLVDETRKRSKHLRVESASDVRAAGEPVVAFSPQMHECEQAIRKFLFARMYRHWKVNRSMSQARRIVRDLFDLFVSEPNTLAPPWSRPGLVANSAQAAAIAGDAIASMTDTFAIEEHRRLFNLERLE